MAEQLSIKINIAKRSYPLQANAEEVEMMRKAEKLINDTLKEFEHSYQVSSVQDLLSMTAFQIAFSLISTQSDATNSQLESSIDKLNELLAPFDDSH
jgi:cell division protein ZapA